MQQQQYFFFKKGAAIRITCNISSGVEDLNRVQRKQNVFCLDANLFPDADQQKCRPLWLWQLPELIFSGDSYQSLLDPFARWEQRSWKPASLWMQPGLFYFLFFFFFSKYIYPHRSSSATSRPTREPQESFLQFTPGSLAFHFQWTQNSWVSTANSLSSVSLTFDRINYFLEVIKVIMFEIEGEILSVKLSSN